MFCRSNEGTRAPSGLVTALGALSWAALGSVACSEPHGASSSSSGRAIAASGGASAPPASASSVAQSTADAKASPLAGEWSGRFESKKKAPTLDPGVKERSWTKDDGKQMAGPGQVSLRVAPDGGVSGTISGALGQGQITGSAEGATISATVTPSEESETAMAGVLVLTLEGNTLNGELNASSADATVVRSAPLGLTRSGK